MHDLEANPAGKSSLLEDRNEPRDATRIWIAVRASPATDLAGWGSVAGITGWSDDRSGRLGSDRRGFRSDLG